MSTGSAAGLGPAETRTQPEEPMTRKTTKGSKALPRKSKRLSLSKKTLKDLGKQMREEARDIVEARLPDRLAELLARLQSVHAKQ